MKPSSYLDTNGPFANVINDFRAREAQMLMSDNVFNVIESNSIVIAEAGTGIGKTFAYLVPSLLSGKKVLVSTGTRHLQDQLFFRDLPAVVSALDINIDAALLKGRSNYLCKYRLDNIHQHGNLSRQMHEHLQNIEHWSRETVRGDISELSDVPEDAMIWPQVTSTVDNCLGAECNDYADCHVMRARRNAQNADVVIVNHHLLLADMALKEQGFGELLPDFEVFIIDEAHQMPDIATRFFGEVVSSRQMRGLCDDIVTEQVKSATEMTSLRDEANNLQTTISDFRLVLGLPVQRYTWPEISAKENVNEALQALVNQLQVLADVLDIAAERSRGLESCYQRCCEFLNRLRQNFLEQDEPGDLAALTGDTQYIKWLETHTRSFVMHMTPLNVSEVYQKSTSEIESAWVYTSATLQVGGRFEHFADQLGIKDYSAVTWPSPFNYQLQSLLYVPPEMPAPGSANYTSELMNRVMPIINASGGRTFLLFTSFRALNEAKDLLEGELSYPMLVQGDLPRHLLLDEFRALQNAVLLGTSSFWEGVDVRGKALSLVVIDKLPFASPGDPVLQARLDAIRQQGGSPFPDYQLPQAVIALKQGAGRLIRDISDHGVLVIGDNRLVEKSYGKTFLASLPDIPLTRNVDDVISFYSALEMHNETAVN